MAVVVVVVVVVEGAEAGGSATGGAEAGFKKGERLDPFPEVLPETAGAVVDVGAVPPAGAIASTSAAGSEVAPLVTRRRFELFDDVARCGRDIRMLYEEREEVLSFQRGEEGKTGKTGK